MPRRISPQESIFDLKTALLLPFLPSRVSVIAIRAGYSLTTSNDLLLRSILWHKDRVLVNCNGKSDLSSRDDYTR